jgi:hypothetical protein
MLTEFLTDNWSFCEADGTQREDVLQSGEASNMLRTIKIRKADWIGHILCTNCLLNHITEGKIEGMIEVTGR